MFRFARILTCLLAGMLLAVPCAYAGEVSGEPDMLAALRPILEDADCPDGVLSPDTAQALRDAAAALGFTLPDEPNDGPLSLDSFVRSLCCLQYGDYFTWSLEARYRFDLLMVDLGQLSRCVNLLPEDDPLTEDAARALALSVIHERFGAECAPTAGSVFYARIAPEDASGTWQFSFTLADGSSCTVHVRNGQVTHCQQERSSALNREYEQLCAERGGFFTWTLQQKADYAALLPEKLARAAAQGEDVLAIKELTAIAHYGFCLPDAEALPQSEAYARAADAVQAQFGLPDGWDDRTEVHYSFFRQADGKFIWRVIFWKTQQEAFPSGVVDMDGRTGEVLRVGRNGTTPNEFIPYLERL